MRYNYKGFWGCDSCCDIEVHRRSDGKHIFVATELPDNPGTSVTNSADELDSRIVALEKTVGARLYRSVLREFGKFEHPNLVKDPLAKEKVL